MAEKFIQIIDEDIEVIGKSLKRLEYLKRKNKVLKEGAAKRDTILANIIAKLQLLNKDGNKYASNALYAVLNNYGVSGNPGSHGNKGVGDAFIFFDHKLDKIDTLLIEKLKRIEKVKRDFDVL